MPPRYGGASGGNGGVGRKETGGGSIGPPPGVVMAQEKGIHVSFYQTHIDGAHPNTALISLTGRSGKTVSLEGASIGGGNIRIRKVNGLEVEISGEATTFIILHNDTPGTIAAVTQF